jgi:hypothetical protein
MSLFSKNWNRALMVGVGAAIVGLASAALPSMAMDACADSSDQRTLSKADPGTMGIDGSYVIQTQTKAPLQQFEHDCFSARPIVEVDVSTSGPANSQPVPFRTYWFNSGKALGQKQFHALNIPQGQSVIINVREGSMCGTLPEHQAAAGAILRMVLSALLNHDKVSAVVLPDSTYSSISAGLQCHNGRILPPGELAPQGAKVSFELQSASGRTKQVMYFI